MKALMKTTKSAKPAEVEKKWHLIDADGLVVGRVLRAELREECLALGLEGLGLLGHESLELGFHRLRIEGRLAAGGHRGGGQASQCQRAGKNQGLLHLFVRKKFGRPHGRRHSAVRLHFCQITVKRRAEGRKTKTGKAD